MTQLQNQFSQSVEKGQLDLKIPSVVLSCMVDSAAPAELVAGDIVKLVDSAGGVPKILKITADTDAVFGMVISSFKDASYPALSNVEIVAFRGGVAYMQSSAAIARGANVMPVVSGSKVATATTGKRIVGYALDKATAANQIIRVVVDLPGILSA